MKSFNISKVYTNKWEQGSIKLLLAFSVALWLATGSIITGIYVLLIGTALIFVHFVRKGAREANIELYSGIKKLDVQPPQDGMLLLKENLQKLGYKVDTIELPGLLIVTNNKALLLFHKSHPNKTTILDDKLLEKGRELLREYQVSKLILATNGFFDDKSLQRFRRHKWLELLDRKDTINLLYRAKNKNEKSLL